jgi:pSer/pThr/pTyr-binding forkhead associated (FHA) protein
LIRGTGRTERFAPGSGGVIGRDAPVVEYHLNHPHVSRLHASLAVDGERVVLADLGNSNGTHVNGQRLTRLTLQRLNTDASLGFGTASFGRIDRRIREVTSRLDDLRTLVTLDP